MSSITQEPKQMKRWPVPGMVLSGEMCSACQEQLQTRTWTSNAFYLATCSLVVLSHIIEIQFAAILVWDWLVFLHVKCI